MTTHLPGAPAPTVARFAVRAGLRAAIITATATLATAVSFTYLVGGPDAVTGRSQTDAWPYPRSTDHLLIQSTHTAMLILIGWSLIATATVGLATACIAAAGRRAQLHALNAEHRSQQRTIESTVWKLVAQTLSDNTDPAYRINLVDAASRLLDTTNASTPSPLFGEATDHLPTQSRAVRIYGPAGAGKTSYAHHLATQERAERRHVTVIRPGDTASSWCEYEYPAADHATITVVNSEWLNTQAARRALVTRFDRNNGRAHPAETVIVESGGLEPENLRDLISRLFDAILAEPNTENRLVVLVDGPNDLSDMPTPHRFDTEILLPGTPGHPAALRAALERFSTDELTLERLQTRINGGGLASSRFERQICDWFTGPAHDYLRQHMTRVNEEPQPTIIADEHRLIQHGILRRPDDRLAELVLPEPLSGLHLQH